MKQGRTIFTQNRVSLILAIGFFLSLLLISLHTGSHHWYLSVSETIIALSFVVVLYSRYRTYKQMKDKERQLTSLVSHLPGFVFRASFEPNGRVMLISDQCKEVTGYDVTDFLGGKQQYYALIQPQFKAKLFKVAKEAEKNKSSYSVEYMITTASGDSKWIHENGTGVYDEWGKTLFFEGYVEDISERKNREFELIAKSEETKKLNEHLIKANAKAVESDRLKTAFLANMSHEIRTPMNGIIGFMELLKEPDLDEKNRREYIELVNVSGYRLLNTINDIIEISKIETGQVNVNYNQINVDEVMNHHMEFFRLECESHGLSIEIDCQIKGEEAFIVSDRNKLDGILSNLIKNAIKFTKKGGITIGNYLAPDYLIFYIKDTGIGIPPEKIDFIFERFGQVEDEYNRSYEGSGLGLSIAKAYVESLGGAIKVESECGVGSKFTFYIPYKKAVRVIEPKSVSTELVKWGSDAIILVAEDDEISYEYMKNLLKDKGFQLIRARNGSEAVSGVRENNVALVLMDIKMPEVDGIEATRQIREFNKHIPIIAQTAYSQSEDKRIILEAGCNDCLTKPIRSEDLMRVIAEHIMYSIRVRRK